MRAIDRLRQLKEEAQATTKSQMFISLTNSKNIQLMETLVAWTCTNVKFDGEKEVPPDTSLSDLWKLNTLDTRQFAGAAGISITDAIAKIRQLKSLNLIFPDGTALSKAISIVRLYVRSKIEDL